ncbi:branched-chain amino acid ABC transporter permease [Xylophilus sp.]|uniref:branched-chain amino acid ABC transporter permease n=1 Tax=Xylophilus sp. TaxID=2653893 RepID=UPI0013BD53B7|nr:branched-chain amino acid ABC transporter permease [Xylophilus sp.]KAF1047758.1 MAG: hypothetical protein GAK38_01701 [Xylophilus sp.]
MGPRLAIWALFAAALVLAPQVSGSSFALTLLSQMGYLAIVCLSYNILLGQGGMLSFGHAVYSGMGAFAAVHAMNLAAVPLALVPVLAGAAGMVLAALLGWVATRRAGTAFAMITLGIGELAAAAALMFPGFFGGEAGVAADRVYGAAPWGIGFGPAIQVYYLIAAYCVACAALMYAFTGTPLGRILTAVRDNPQRVAFLGYDARRVRHLAFAVAGFFAGVGGGLAAIQFEIVTAADSMGPLRSASYLLFTFLGGTGFFFGPVVGAVLMVLASVLLPEWTRAWPLYLGLAFLLMVLHAPGGIAGVLAANLRVARHGRLGALAWLYLGLAAAGAVALLGASALVEMAYRLRLDAALGPRLPFLGREIDAGSAATWAGAAAVLALGLGLLRILRPRFAVRWAAVPQAIAAEEGAA